MSKELELNPNKLVAYLGKPTSEFTKADIVRYITENGIRMVTFMCPHPFSQIVAQFPPT